MKNLCSTIAPAALVVIVFLSFVGYSYPLLISDWYRPVNVIEVVEIAAGQAIFALPNLIYYNPTLAAIFVISLAIACFKRPKEKYKQSLTLLAGMLPGLVLTAWGSYWYLHSTYGPIPESKVLIAREGLELFFQFSCVPLLVLLGWVLISKRWHSRKAFAISVLLMQYIYFKANVYEGMSSLDFVILGV